MRQTTDKSGNFDHPRTYQIKVRGHLGEQWSGWFGGMAVEREKDGYTTFQGLVSDQAELHALLRKVRDLGMPLVSVEEITPAD